MKIIIWSQYHPAAALHNPRLWAELLEDWAREPAQVPHDFIVGKGNLNLQGMPFASLDTETDNHGGLGQWSVAYRDGEGRLTVSSFFGKQPIEYGNCPIVFHNAKYDLRELAKNKMPLPKNFHDTMIAAYCLGLSKQAPGDSTNRSGSNLVGGLGLKYLGRRHLGMVMKKWDEVKDHPELVPAYNADDSVATYLLFEKWLPTLPEHYFKIDMPLLPCIMAMEDRGIMIDPTYLNAYAKELDNRLASFDDDVQYLAFHNIDLQSFVYGSLEIEPWAFTDAGSPSVDADVLEEIFHKTQNQTVGSILEYKKLYKDKGTYIDSYIRGRDDNDRIHPEFKQVSTSTGRLSCANPNLQNVDKKGNMRKLFVAPPGKLLVRMDWKKLEFGMLAVLANDEKLIKAFLADTIHQETADSLGVEYDVGKHINFLMQNGGGAWGMSMTYGIPIGLANEYIERYFKRFPAIKKYQDKVVAEALATKHVVGPWGRRRRLDALFSERWKDRKDGEKEAKTMPMQNGGAELVKLAMIDLFQKHNAPMLNQVHDEILFEIDSKDALDYAYWLESYVPKITPFRGVEFPVDVSVGKSWWATCQDNWKEIL